MELMGLGLPLQGPAWTECACVGVGVGVSAWSPTGWTSKRGGGVCVHVFGPLQHLWCVVSTAWSRPPTSNSFKTDARWTRHMTGRPLKKPVQVDGPLPTLCDITKSDSSY